MLNAKIRSRLESLRELPAIPHVMTQVLNSLDNPNMSAAGLAQLIERDQALTARVLRVANSPFYGFARKISTIDLAVVVLGVNSIKEIILSLFIQKFFSRMRNSMFDLREFWKYSLFSGACCRLLARKLGYRLAGEAFVSGLMHDIGVLIIVEHFSAKFKEIREYQKQKKCSMLDAENIILDTNHCDIGAWIAEKWNFPGKLCEAIQNHHTHFSEFIQSPEAKKNLLEGNIDFAEIDQQLTAIVSMSEWFSGELGFKKWAMDYKKSSLYLADEVFEEFKQHDVLEPDSAFEMLKSEILEEYNRASILGDVGPGPLK